MGFEPHALGESVRDTLVVSSAAGGEYLVPLMGRCGPPKPQGPIDLSEVRTSSSRRTCRQFYAYTWPSSPSNAWRQGFMREFLAWR